MNSDNQQLKKIKENDNALKISFIFAVIPFIVGMGISNINPDQSIYLWYGMIISIVTFIVVYLITSIIWLKKIMYLFINEKFEKN